MKISDGVMVMSQVVAESTGHRRSQPPARLFPPDLPDTPVWLDADQWRRRFGETELEVQQVHVSIGPGDRTCGALVS